MDSVPEKLEMGKETLYKREERINVFFYFYFFSNFIQFDRKEEKRIIFNFTKDKKHPSAK